MKKKRSSWKIVCLALMGSATVTLQPVDAQSYDMDCKVILCIAGGFPSECSDAYRYMIKRITRFPKPLPPFGFCAMSDGSEYTDYTVSYNYLHRGRQAYDCPEGKQLFYHFDDTNRGWNETVFCYSRTIRERAGWGRDEEWRTVYHDREPARRVNFRLKLVVEPGTRHEFRSPTFRINYHTGYVSRTAN